MNLRRPSRLRVYTASFGVGLLTILTACGGSEDSSQVASLGGDNNAATETTTSADTQQQWLDFAQCMRDNGVAMEDPTFDADGNLQGGGFGPDSGIDFRDDAARTALESCRELMPNVGPGGGGGARFDQTAIQDAFNAFTSCLRDQGLDVDDIEFGVGPGGGAGDPGGPPGTGDLQPPPDSSGGFNGGPPQDGAQGGGDFDPTARIIEQLGLDDTDPAVTAAVDACSATLTDALSQRGGDTDNTAGG